MSIDLSYWLILVADLILALGVTVHVLLNKRDPRAAIGWIGLCWLAPFIGSILYFLFGINRVHTRARRLAKRSPFQAGDSDPVQALSSDAHALALIGDRVSGQPLVGGNRIDCLHNGEEAYPAMLSAMTEAKQSLFLTTYIFDTQATGQTFMEALEQATKRGVDVRVIVDGIGEFSNIPRASKMLRQRGVRVARFTPPKLLPPSFSINLRNHRKILVVDGQTAFTGGMNISNTQMADSTDPKRVTDVHFRLSGPVVNQIEAAFLEDWGFTTGERIDSSGQSSAVVGDALCRVIVDGPNEYLDQLTQVITATICAARERVGIMTPYFLPSRGLMAAIRAAALRGVDVMIILPGQSDHAFVHWASRHILDLLLKNGVQIFYQPAPFAHSKLLVIDHDYALVGSANLDPRSLRLNFELGVEIFDNDFADELWSHMMAIRQRSHTLTLTELEQRHLGTKLRDAAAWVCSPYL